MTLSPAHQATCVHDGHVGRSFRWSRPRGWDVLATAPHEKPETVAVFLLPGLSGIVDEFAALLAPGKAPLNFVPLSYRHWSELRQEPDEFDRLITDCVRQIESHGPPPTIFLVGYSFGGIMGLAIARALAASGHRIGLLGLIDALAAPKIEPNADTIIGRVGRFVRGVRRGETGQQMARSSAGILFRASDTTRNTFRRLHGSGFLTRILNCIDISLQGRYHVVQLRECISRMAAAPDRVDYPTVLFRCSERPPGEDADLGWSRYIANLRVVTLPGDHASVLQRENVEQINTQLTATISEGEGNPLISKGQLYVKGTGCLLSEDHLNCRRIG